MDLLQAHDKDLGGGFMVRRLLPAAARRSVGPFVFFDHMGPVTEHPGRAHDVRPHPHIGLATVTYLFEGAMMHRDSLGHAQEVLPGAINWMTAGRGIVHSERKPDRLLQAEYVNHGLQLWAALPREFEEAEPSFIHTPAEAIPELHEQGAKVRVLIGEAFSVRSPVATFAPTLYLDIELTAGARFALPALATEMAMYVVTGELAVDGQPVPAHAMAVLPDGAGRRAPGRSGAGKVRGGRRCAARWAALYHLELCFEPARAHPCRPETTGPRSAWDGSPAKRNSFHCRGVHFRCRGTKRPSGRTACALDVGGRESATAAIGRWVGSGVCRGHAPDRRGDGRWEMMVRMVSGNIRCA